MRDRDSLFRGLDFCQSVECGYCEPNGAPVEQPDPLLLDSPEDAALEAEGLWTDVEYDLIVDAQVRERERQDAGACGHCATDNPWACAATCPAAGEPW